MWQVQLTQQRQRIERAFDMARSLSADAELQAHWARYLCVLVAGYLETSIRLLYGQYCEMRSAVPVARYVNRQLNAFQNPNMERIVQLAGSFDQDWADELKRLGEGEIKAAVDSIRYLRNDIAHGGTAEVTYIRIRNYYEHATKLLDIIERQCS